MGKEYQAFISYRHAEVDSRVAAEVQRSLERFHVPFSTRKQTGKKSLAPVFRDKEELPVTSELGKDIADALEHAGHLIVICSPRTSESTWVQREIDTFLKTHSPDDVLTVLAEGEPEDVIPPVLLERRRVITLEDGTAQEAIVPVEPLSCDFRSAKKADHRPEVTRLAAAMLGVPFDSLVRRQQRYRRRIALAAATLALGIIAYGAWSLVQIQQGLVATQRSQSAVLAHTALNLYEEGNALEALEIALAALPGTGGDRPVVAEAEYALQQITRAYQPPLDGEVQGRPWVTDYGPVRSFRANGSVSDIACTPDGSYMAAITYNGKLNCWNVDSGELIPNLSDAEDVIGIEAFGDNRFLVVLRNGLRCIEPENGKELWTANLFEGELGYYSLIGATADTAKDEAVAICEGGLYRVDLKNGHICAAEPLEGIAGEYSLFSTSVIGEGFYALGWDDNREEDGIRVLLGNYETGKTQLSEQRFPNLGINLLQPISGGRMLVDSLDSETYSAYLRSSGTDYSAGLVPYKHTVTCLDSATGKTLWSQDIDLWQVVASITVFETQLRLEDGKAHDVVVWCGANVCAYLDAADGTLLGRIEVPSPFIDAWPELDAKGGETKAIRGCLNNGSYATCIPERKQSVSTSGLPANANCVTSTQRGEFVGADDVVFLCAHGRNDTSFKPIALNCGLIEDPIPLQGAFAVLDLTGSNHNGTPTVSRIDPVEGSVSWSTPLAKPEDYYNLDYLGLTEDHSTLVFRRTVYDAAYAFELILVDAATGSAERTALSDQASSAEEQRALCGFNALVAGNKLVSSLYTSEEREDGTSLGYRLCVTDLETMESALYDIGEETFEPMGSAKSLFTSGSSDRILVSTEQSADTNGAYRCLAVNLADGSSWEVGVPLLRKSAHTQTASVNALWGDGGELYAVGTGACIGYSPEGRELFRYDIGKSRPLGMSLSKDELELYLFDGETVTMVRLDRKNGSLRGSNLLQLDIPADTLGSMSNPMGYPIVRYDIAADASDNRDKRILHAYDTMFIVDNDGAVHQKLDSLGYDTASDTFVVMKADESTLGIYERYSVEELVERGRELLGDAQMSEAQRAEFGL